jgi:alpha-N-acetylglucosaminidase
LNKILGSNKNFLFGKWVQDAKNSAKSFTNSAEIIEQFRFNAVNQVTVWGPRSGNNNDYASKSWNGLMLYY